MWISRIKLELLQHDLENAKKKSWETDDRYRALEWENFDLKDKIRDLKAELGALKSENSALIELLSEKNKEKEEDNGDKR